MENKYYLIDADAVSECLKQVVAVKSAIGRGKTNILRECEKAGISRATYYKYKDFIFAPSDMAGSRKAVMDMMLRHEPGVLSALLNCISAAGASVVTITQSPPIHEQASVTLTLDLSAVSVPVQQLTSEMSVIPGVDNLRLLAVE